jgi:hypothetical protein
VCNQKRFYCKRVFFYSLPPRSFLLLLKIWWLVEFIERVYIIFSLDIYLSELKLVEQQKIDIAEESITTTSLSTTTAEEANKEPTTASKKTITFSKMLVAIDGSDASMDAADYAIFISKEYNAELLYALHVIHQLTLIYHLDRLRK